MIMRGLGRWHRPSLEVKSASLSRATDFHFDRDPLDHEPHDENHSLTLLSASFEIARADIPGFPSEAQVLLHLKLA
jgi:hypothetical protein